MGTYTPWSEYEIDKTAYFTATSGSGSSCSSRSSGSAGSAGSSSSSWSSGSSGSAAPSIGSEFFSDVKQDEWYYNAVKYMHDKGLMKGTSDNEFSPETPLTRAMFVTILYRTENEPQTNAKHVFSNVCDNKYYSAAAAWAKENNIVSGVTDTEFAPDINITRE